MSRRFTKRGWASDEHIRKTYEQEKTNHGCTMDNNTLDGDKTGFLHVSEPAQEQTCVPNISATGDIPDGVIRPQSVQEWTPGRLCDIWEYAGWNGLAIKINEALSAEEQKGLSKWREATLQLAAEREKRASIESINRTLAQAVDKIRERLAVLEGALKQIADEKRHGESAWRIAKSSLAKIKEGKA